MLFMNPSQQQDPQIQIEVDEQISRGIYSNLALIAHSETEFILDFIFLQPQNPKAKVLSRIISSPGHAKRLLWALKDNIEKYEARFGPIRAGAPSETPEKAQGFYQ